MTEFLTRKQLREAERKGLIPTPQTVAEDVVEVATDLSSTQESVVSNANASLVEAELSPIESDDSPSEAQLEEAKASFSQAKAAADNQINLRTVPAATPAPKIIETPVEEIQTPQPEIAESTTEPALTRKQLRELERSGKLPDATKAKTPGGIESVPLPVSQEIAPVVISEAEVVELEPELSLPTSAEIEAIDSTSENAILDAAELNLDAPSIEFSGANLFAEPSTQSIVLDVAPEAISLPIETGEITVTGSITVLAESATGAITGGLDGLVLDSIDQQDAVTGIISTVEPISAIDIINERVNVGVVPKSVLRKGWWRPYALGLIGLLMAIAAILATITIINALGA